MYSDLCILKTKNLVHLYVDSADTDTRPCSAVGNMSGCRYVSDYRSRGHKFDPGPVTLFH